MKFTISINKYDFFMYKYKYKSLFFNIHLANHNKKKLKWDQKKEIKNLKKLNLH